MTDLARLRDDYRAEQNLNSYARRQVEMWFRLAFENPSCGETAANLHDARVTVRKTLDRMRSLRRRIATLTVEA